MPPEARTPQGVGGRTSAPGGGLLARGGLRAEDSATTRQLPHDVFLPRENGGCHLPRHRQRERGSPKRNRPRYQAQASLRKRSGTSYLRGALKYGQEKKADHGRRRNPSSPLFRRQAGDAGRPRRGSSK